MSTFETTPTAGLPGSPAPSPEASVAPAPQAEVPPVPAARRRVSRRALLLAGAGLALPAGGAAAWAATRADAYEFKGGEITPPRAAPALDLTDQDGQPFTLAQRAGKVLLVYFGYTFCPSMCPTTMLDFQAVKEQLGADAAGVEFVFVTFDPERDTPQRLVEYLDFFDPEFTAVRGDRPQTDAFLKAYGVTVKRVEYPDSAAGYLLDHTAFIYLVDQEGRLRLTYPYGTDPALITEDVQHLVG